MSVRSELAAVVLALALAGPVRLLELDHGHLHRESSASASHPECPVCIAAKAPVVVAWPSTPLPELAPQPVVAVSLSEAPGAAVLLGIAPARGPPA